MLSPTNEIFCPSLKALASIWLLPQSKNGINKTAPANTMVLLNFICDFYVTDFFFSQVKWRLIYKTGAFLLEKY